MAAYQDILKAQVLTGVFRQVVSAADSILNFMGFEPGGSNEKNFGHGRSGIFHVYDDSRKAAKERAPGTPAGRSAKQNMKAVPFIYPRMHDSVHLLAEFVHNLGKIEDPATRDIAGRDMIMRQTKTLMQKAANWRVAMTVGMLRDQLYVHESGNDWYVNYTSTSALTQRSFGVPSGNKSQLNMTDRAGSSVHGGSIVDVTWLNPAANIPLHIAKINAARAAQGVGPIRNILCNSILWQSVVNNDFIAGQAGIANAPYKTFERVVGTRPDGSHLHEYIGTIGSMPGIEWRIHDEGVELWNGTTETFTKHVPDTMAIFMGEPKASDKYTLYQGSEPIAEYDGGPESVRAGLSAWSKKVSNPTGTEIYVLDNALPVPHDPYDIAPATVVF